MLKEICSRLKLSGQLNEVTVGDIRALRAHGIDLEEIERAIREVTGISREKLKALLDDVVERNQRYYTELATLADITVPDIIVSAADIAAIQRQTWSAFQNITGSMGFLVREGGRLKKLPPADTYWGVLDSATMKIQSGAISYNQAISDAVKELADSGLKTVDYESGHVDSVDVSARRAVMTAVNQICDKYADQSAEYLGTRYFEISAHSGARDICRDPKRPWQNHKSWHGKVYYMSEFGEPDPLKRYPDLVKTTGYNEVDGLTGANCRHHKYPWIEGAMERTYTDEDLAHIDDGLECEFEGRKYSAYESTQQQRKIEKEIRKLKRRKAAQEAAGLTEEATNTNIRLRRLNKKYRDFSAAAGLPLQRDRIKVVYK